VTGPAALRVGPVTLGGVIRSEWIKLRSVRSTPAVLMLSVVLMAVFPLLLGTRPSYNPVDQSLFGVHFATLTVSVLGVLAITGEYATGTILATFCAVPRRLPVLWAKAAVLGAVVFAVSLAAALLAVAAGQARYGGAPLASAGAVRAIVGTALFLTVMGLFGLGFGSWTRSTAGGITAVIAFTYIFSQGGDVLPASWQPHVIPYLPFQAGEAVYTVQPYPAYAHELLGPWAGLGVLCGYLAVTLAAAAVTVRRTDATAAFGWRQRARGLLPRARRPAGYGETGAAGPARAASSLAALSPVAVRPVTLAAVASSEWIKARSVRSPGIVAAFVVVLIVATGLIATVGADWPAMTAAQRAGFDPVGQSLLGVRNFADVPAGILGVLLVTGDYTTGMVRAVFCAVPRRLPVLWAKAAVLAPALFTVTLLASLAAFLGGQALLGRHGVSLGAPGALRAVAGAALFLTVAGLLGTGLGFLTRSTAGGIAAFVGVQDVLSEFRLALPASWQPHVGPYLPGDAGKAVFATPPYGADTLHPWAGFAVYCGYAAAVLAVAAIALRKRDA
jgi:ABC-2 type transport system permease protein